MQQSIRRVLVGLVVVASVVALCTGGLWALDSPPAEKPAAAQGAMPEMSPEMKAMMEAWQKAGKPGAEHKMLAESVGDWTATVKTWMGPGEPMVSQATAHREMMLDGRVMAETFKGNMMGQPFEGHGMVGHDNASKQWWSVWTDSMSTGAMVSWGKWDDKEKAVVFEGQMTDPMTGKPFKTRSISRHPAPGQEIFELWEEHDGKWMKTLEIALAKK